MNTSKVNKKRRGAARKRVKKDDEDIRVVKNDQRTLTPSTSQPSIVIQVPLTAELLYGVCISYVDKAISRGYLSRSATPDSPYHASIYMLNVLLSYVKATPPLASALPEWLQCFGQALSPKIVPFEQGCISYNFVTTSDVPTTLPPVAPIGPLPFSYAHIYYKPDDSVTVDQFPRAIPPVAYTDALGQSAWAELSAYMVEEGNPWSQINALHSTGWQRSVSAFAFPANIEGGGFTGFSSNAGGIMYQSNLEVPIFSPCLSVFGNFLIDGAVSPTRYGREVLSSAGDALWASAIFHSRSGGSPMVTNMKKAPRFQCVDFLEFGDVLAQWVVLATKTMMSSTVNSLGAPYADLRCPLTLQEMLLLLKNEIMYVWGSSQVAVQGIYPRQPITDNDNEFIAYPTSTNTIALSSSGMLLPVMLVENVKALCERWIQTRKKKMRCYVPVLGQYQNDVLQGSTYTFEIDNNSFDAFQTDPLIQRRKTVKGVDIWEPTVEAAIDLIDGTSGPNWYFINDTKRLRDLSTLWNEWVSNKISTYSITLARLSTELGVNVCASVGTTRHWVPVPANVARRQLVERDVRLVSRPYLTSPIYGEREAVAISQAQRFYSPAFDNIESIWVLGINKSQAGPDKSAQTLFTRMQIMLGESFSNTSAVVDSAPTLADVHAIYAAAMVRNVFGKSTEIEQFFDQQAAEGHGGVLSGLVASFLGKTFGPNVGSIAGAVADIIPI